MKDVLGNVCIETGDDVDGLPEVHLVEVLDGLFLVQVLEGLGEQLGGGDAEKARTLLWGKLVHDLGDVVAVVVLQLVLDSTWEVAALQDCLDLILVIAHLGNCVASAALVSLVRHALYSVIQRHVREAWENDGPQLATRPWWGRAIGLIVAERIMRG